MVARAYQRTLMFLSIPQGRVNFLTMQPASQKILHEFLRFAIWHRPQAHDDVVRSRQLKGPAQPENTLAILDLSQARFASAQDHEFGPVEVECRGFVGGQNAVFKVFGHRLMGKRSIGSREVEPRAQHWIFQRRKRGGVRADGVHLLVGLKKAMRRDVHEARRADPHENALEGKRTQEDFGVPVRLLELPLDGFYFHLSAWEWGELGWRTYVDRALPNPGVIPSCDTEAELNSQAVRFQQLDGLLLPGGLATWMIRGHPGLKQLVQEMNTARKPIGAIERGPKLLFLTGVLDGRTITCAPQMRDDILQAVVSIHYTDVPVVQDGNLITCRGTEDLPNFMQALLSEYGKPGR